MKSLEEFTAWFREISLPVYLCCIFLGISSWVDISGVWLQLPVLVNELPEGWNLPSYLITIMQLGQLGPLIFIIANRRSPNQVKEWPVIFFIIGIGAVSCLLLSFFWEKTTMIAGEMRSIGLFSLTAALALVDLTSSVVYLGYMSIFKPQYMTGYYIGDGFSSLIPGLVVLGQGTGGDPNCVNRSNVLYNDTTRENVTTWRVVDEYQEPKFSVQTFFLFLFTLLTVSFIAFTILHFAPFAKKEHCSFTDAQNKFDKEMHDCKTSDISTISNKDLEASGKVHSRDEDGRDPRKTAISNRALAGIVFVNSWVMFLTYGLHKSFESYAALPYGNQAYALSVRLSQIADPIACFTCLLVPRVSVRKIIVLVITGTVLCIYQLTLAILSPNPPLKGQVGGEFLVVTSAVLMVSTFSYTRVAISIYLQSRGGRRGLLWAGAIGQLGVFVGVTISFLVVNVYGMLHRAYPCSSEIST